MEVPTNINSLTAKELTALAKAKGTLTYKLMRSSIVGWIAFVITLSVLVFALIYIALKPQPILVVNKQGELVARLDWLETAIRTDAELSVAIRHFLTLKNSVNSNTVQFDRLQALNIMSKVLQEKHVEQEVLAIQAIRRNNNYGYVKVDSVEQLNRTGNTATYKVTGRIILIASETRSSNPYEYVVGIDIRPRTQSNTLGIMVTTIE